jgi:hypothetical protein
VRSRAASQTITNVEVPRFGDKVVVGPLLLQSSSSSGRTSIVRAAAPIAIAIALAICLVVWLLVTSFRD